MHISKNLCEIIYLNPKSKNQVESKPLLATDQEKKTIGQRTEKSLPSSSSEINPNFSAPLTVPVIVPLNFLVFCLCHS